MQDGFRLIAACVAERNPVKTLGKEKLAAQTARFLFEIAVSGGFETGATEGNSCAGREFAHEMLIALRFGAAQPVVDVQDGQLNRKCSQNFEQSNGIGPSRNGHSDSSACGQHVITGYDFTDCGGNIFCQAPILGPSFIPAKTCA